MIICILLFSLFHLSHKKKKKKTVICYDKDTKKDFVVHISGNYYEYPFQEDRFQGEIEIEGKRSNTGTFVFQKDLYTNLVDEYGQPMEILIQYDHFTKIEVVGQNYYINNFS